MHDQLEEFDGLRRLLALKRHEVPPPRFFDELPRQVMSAILERKQSRWQILLDDIVTATWFQPAVATVTAVFVGALVVYSILNADHLKPSMNSALFPDPAAGILAPVPTTNVNSALHRSDVRDLSYQPVGANSQNGGQALKPNR